MLKHKDSRRFQDFIWHWFLLIGYEGEGEKMTVTAATYGEAVKLPFYDFWDTGYAEKRRNDFVFSVVRFIKRTQKTGILKRKQEGQGSVKKKIGIILCAVLVVVAAVAANC